MGGVAALGCLVVAGSATPDGFQLAASVALGPASGSSVAAGFVGGRQRPPGSGGAVATASPASEFVG